MAKVKVSPVRQMTVVPYRPWRSWSLRIIGIVMAALAVYAAYLYGFQTGGSQYETLLTQRAELRQNLSQSEQRQEALRIRVAQLERGTEVDRQANENARQTQLEMRGRIAGLEEEVALYQGIMSPSLENEGLRIQEITLESTSSSNRYRYSLMLTQAGNNSEYLQGFVGVNIVGTQNGERVALPLKDVSETVEDVDIRFRYRYFQDIKGDLVLPEGFIPDQIQVTAQAVGERAAQVESAYNWLDLENGNNVGQQ